MPDTVGSQRRYHQRLFHALEDWDTARAVVFGWRVDESPSGLAGTDQLGHFGPTGCDLVVDALADALPGGVGVLVELGSGLGGPLRYVCDRLRRRGTPVGTGLGVELVAEHCRASDAIARSLGVTDCRAVCASADDVPLGDGTVDAVMVTGSMPHFADPGRVLAEAARVLRPGGALVLTEEVSIRAPGRAVSAEFRALHPEGVFFVSTAEERRGQLAAAGLTDVRQTDLGAWAVELLGERLRVMKMFRGLPESLFGADEAAAIARTLAVARTEYAAGALLPMLVTARRSR
ncbi:MAG TPA: class I SAM-dependent methyltransferase [Mycobacteriales bacterium]|jgi:SAM-dependent methyltransferase